MSMKKFGKDIETHIMTGISYMIPLVIAGAVLMAISRVGFILWNFRYLGH